MSYDVAWQQFLFVSELAPSRGAHLRDVPSPVILQRLSLRCQGRFLLPYVHQHGHTSTKGAPQQLSGKSDYGEA